MSNYWVHKLYDVKDSKKIVRRGTIWNLASSIINSVMTAVIMFFIALTNDVSINGWFSIASAIAYQCQSVGFFGVRSFHIADTKKEFCFSDYFIFNVISTIVMIFILSYLSFSQGYVLDKALLIFIYGIFRGIDIIEALFHDEYQRNGRLDIGVILQTIRFLCALLVLIVTLLITKNIVTATFLSTIISALMVYWQNKPFTKLFPCKFSNVRIKSLKRIFVICFPIFVAGFVNMYLANASKYAIETNLDDTMQGIYAILSLPIFTINLLSTVIYKPYISSMAMNWYDKNFRVFNKIVKNQILVIIFLTVLITFFGYAIGLKILEILYGVNLINYMDVFILLLIGGGVNTLGAFLNFIMIIFREQNKNMMIYMISGCCTILMSSFLINHFKLLGASLIYILSSSIVTIFCSIILIRKYKKIKNAQLFNN